MNDVSMKRKLKVAQLVPYYPPVIGGVEIVCQYISEELAERGHEVHVFTANRTHKGSPRQQMPGNEVINGVNVHRFRSFFNLGHYGFFQGSFRRLGRVGLILYIHMAIGSRKVKLVPALALGLTCRLFCMCMAVFILVAD